MKNEHLTALSPDEQHTFRKLRSRRTRLRNAIKHTKELRERYGPAHEGQFDEMIAQGLRDEVTLDGQIVTWEAKARLRYEGRE